MSRQSERERAGSVLAGLGTALPAIYEGAVRSLAGSALPAAALLSGGLSEIPGTRGGVAGYEYRLSATLYVACEVGGEAAAEDTLDGLTYAVGTALAAAGYRDIRADASPDGAPLRAIDGRVYRVERISFTTQEY